MSTTERLVDNGAQLPEQRRASDVLQSIQIAGATWNFHRIHWDDDYARSEQLPGAIVNSAQLMAWLEALIEDTYGPDVIWHRFTIRFRAPVLLGAEVVCGGVVTEAAASDGGDRLSVRLWIRSAESETVHAEGQATVEVPR